MAGARFDDWLLEEEVGVGASGVVFRASRGDGTLAALKIARSQDAWVGEEAHVVARLQRLWGPSLLDVGRLPETLALSGGQALACGAVWMATTWTSGERLDVRATRCSTEEERRALLSMVAHGVGRGLDELHRSGVRHGDVKPENILLGESRPRVDRAADRAATLVDLDLASDVASGELKGGTPRYLAPELRAGEALSPLADLYALGLVLAEILVPELLEATTLDDARVKGALEAAPAASTEMVAVISSLVARAPGARPSAAWLASRAARWLGLASDPEEIVLERRSRVRRAYVAVRLPRIAATLRVSPSIEGPARAWLEEALACALPQGEPPREPEIAPLSALGTARWLVSLVGPSAASWPLPRMKEGALASRLLELSDVAPPEAWTASDIVHADRAAYRASRARGARPTEGPSLWIELARSLATPCPEAATLDRTEEEVSGGCAPAGLARDLAMALLRLGDVGRAFAAIVHADEHDEHALVVRAEIERRRGDRVAAEQAARRAAQADDVDVQGAARAVLGRLSWDVGDLDGAEAVLGDAGGAGAAEVRALVAYSRGDFDRGLAAVDAVGRSLDGGLGLARIEGTRGMLEHARGRARESLEAFGRAVELATRVGAVVEEATYLTGLAAAAVDAGSVASALAASTRGALLWERLGRPSLAARAHLSRAAAFALASASHEADMAAAEARRLALASNDVRAAAFARWAVVETRPFGDSLARREALAASDELARSSEEDRVRAAARVLLWARDEGARDEGARGEGAFDVSEMDERARTCGSAIARWEWWGARAQSPEPSHQVLSELVALLDVAAPIGSRGPALEAGARLARSLGVGEVARRIESLRRALAFVLREGTPAELVPSLAAVSWLSGASEEEPRTAIGGAQVLELEAIVRALSSRDRLKPLLEQVVDTMVLWTGVERGLLLLRAPDARLVPRAARNLARQDLAGDQLELSMGLARRAMAERQAICATDAFTQVGELHASVHALGLRSVLAAPLIARGDVLGVVYLDDRVRRGAFGSRELAWVRLVSSQAALAIADARDQAMLRRAVRKAERANARLAMELGAREAELETMRAELASEGSDTRYRYDEIFGRSEPMRAMLRLVDRVTASSVPVLLTGESGTGKELVARAIHRNGARSRRSFVSENCGSVPETLLESTLFGHVRGAFTGASAPRAGLFDVADGGTLFLDEIGEMPLSMQTKLLRVLQDGEIRPVGGERSRNVDVRIVGATHRDLDAMVAAGTFRQDLFYRLNVVTIRVPPLRERREDIPLLVSRFVAKYAGDRKVKVSRAAMDRLTTFPWPGNVRQLENEVRRALVLADDRIDVSELSEEIARGGPSAARSAGVGLKARVDALELELVREALEKTGGNQTRAAEVLGISRFGLQKMMRRLGIRASKAGA